VKLEVGTPPNSYGANAQAFPNFCGSNVSAIFWDFSELPSSKSKIIIVQILAAGRGFEQLSVRAAPFGKSVAALKIG
jgi:hypothetical protein